MVFFSDLSKVLQRANLLRAGRIIRSKEEIEASFILKFFDNIRNNGLNGPTKVPNRERKIYSSGGLRNAFKGNPREF